VIDSANPEFFIAHADVNLILRLPREPQPPPTELPLLHAMADRFRTMPKATIAVTEGRARGGGSELALAMDMRFAARGKAVLAQSEVGVGITPGGGGTQRLTHLVGRARALEIILGCNDIDADLAERWSYVNRALEENELRPFVDALARRIASFPPGAIAHTKAAVTAAEPDMAPGLLDEAHRFAQRVRAAALLEAVALRSRGAVVQIMTPDDSARPLMGRLMDPDRGGRVLAAGYQQGLALGR
jgi:enoyl-CoA hydratase/carnithine racemase